MKYIHAVDYDRIKTNDGNFPKTRIIGETYLDEFDGTKDKIVNAISEIISDNRRTILICYTDGSDEEIVEWTNIYRKSK